MKDNQILDLYRQRSENAISETEKKYGNYCYSIAYNILLNEEDAQECVNDTYWNAWNTIPPQHPRKLRTFLGKLTRNNSLNRYKYNTAMKRGNGQVPIALDELAECIPSYSNVEKAIADKELLKVLNRFLAGLSKENRRIFMRRYWYLYSIKEIARDYAITESKVKMSLLRSRQKLKILLEKQGIVI